MNRSFDAEACNLKKSFSPNTKYTIPEYQREFVWKEREVSKLLEDIEGQYEADPNHDYFIGTILVARVNNQLGDFGEHYEVIDGQQRLTSLFLLLSAFLNLFKEKENPKYTNATQQMVLDNLLGVTLEQIPRLTLGYDNADSYIRKMLCVEGGSTYLEVSDSLRNLEHAYSLMYKHLQANYNDNTRLQDFFSFVVHRVVFIRITTTYSNALTIFETINERGIGLDPMDLLKNLLFKQVSREDFPRIKELWGQIVQPLQKAKENPLRFLRYFLMANYPMKKPSSMSALRQSDVYDWLINEENAALCGYVENPYSFLAKIKRNADAYLNLTQSKYKDGSDCTPLKNLHALTSKPTRIHLVLLLAGLDLPKHLFEHLVAQLESYFFHYIFSGVTQRFFEVSFSQWATPLRKIAQELDPQKQKESLNEFYREYFIPDLSEKNRFLRERLKVLDFSQIKKYQVKYFLGSISNFVEKGFSGASSGYGVSNYLSDGFEIEHILPNKPKPENLEIWGEGNPGVPYDHYKNRLGNLVLLEKTFNRSASNKSFEEKISNFYQKSGVYLTRSIYALDTIGKNTSTNRINEHLQSFPTWNARAIEERQEMLTNLALEIWKIRTI